VLRGFARNNPLTVENGREKHFIALLPPPTGSVIALAA
jgi:hypothetical protein